MVAILLSAALPGAPRAAEPARIHPPACPDLVAWSASIDTRDGYRIAPRLDLPRAFQESAFSNLFGRPALSWTDDDFQTAYQAIDACQREAGKQRDTKARQALTSAKRALSGSLRKTVDTLEKSRGAAQASIRALAEQPDSAALDRALAALLEADPAAPNLASLRGLPPELSATVSSLGRALPTLADEARGPVLDALSTRRAAIQQAMANDAETALEARPASADGVIELIRERGKLSALADPLDRTRLENAITVRIAQIREELQRADHPGWIPPDCIGLYRWAAAPQARRGVAAGRGNVAIAFTEEQIRPVFGISVADWTDDDLARFAKLCEACQAEVEALRQPALEADAAARGEQLKELADKGRWIAGARRDGEAVELVAARKTLLDHRQSLASLQTLQARLAALPDTADSLASLNQIRLDPVLNEFGQAERTRFISAFNLKLLSVSARISETAKLALTKFDVKDLEDLKALRDHALEASNSIPLPADRQLFLGAYDRRLHEAATALLPQFQVRLDAIPGNLEGVGEAQRAVSSLGFENGEQDPGLRPLRDAANKRADGIVLEMRRQACDALLSELGAQADAAQPVWDGQDGIALGELLCGLAEQGASVSAYSGAGLFSKESSLKLNLPGRALQTFSLHKAEVLPGRSMLVGFNVKDANETRRLSVEEWANFAEFARTREFMDIEGCKQFSTSEAGKIAPGLRPYWLRCALRVAGTGDSGTQTANRPPR